MTSLQEATLQDWLIEVTGVIPGEDAYVPDLYNPPRSWFEELPSWWDELDQYSLTVDSQGRVAGLIANWDTCYLNFEDRCWTAPEIKEREEYAYQGNILTAEGDRLPVSILAATKGHHFSDNLMSNVLANQGYLDDNYQPLIQSYDVMAHQLAYGRYKNTPQGIAFLGAIFPHVSRSMVDRINASAVSGHWQQDLTDDEYHFLGAVFVNRGALPLRDKSSLQLRNIAASLRYNHIMAEPENCSCKDAPQEVHPLVRHITAATDPNQPSTTTETGDKKPVLKLEEVADMVAELIGRVATLETSVIDIIRKSEKEEGI